MALAGAAPGWAPGEPWPQEVSSYAIDDGARLLLFDPLSVPDDLLELAAERETAVALTAPWHERDTQSLVERLGAVYAPPPDTAADLMHKFGITAEQAGDGSPDLVRSAPETQVSGIDTRPAIGWPFGIEGALGREHNDMVLWVEDHNAVVCGDTLVDFGDGFGIASWLRAEVTREQVVAGLRPLLDRPVEHVLGAWRANRPCCAERALS